MPRKKMEEIKPTKKFTDTERLDWILKTGAVIVEDDSTGNTRYRACHPPITYLTRDWYPSKRLAIDAAMTGYTR